MKTLAELREEYKAKVKAISEIADAATGESRSLTDDEEQKAKALYIEVKSFQDEISKQETKDELHRQMKDLGSIGVTDPGKDGASVADVGGKSLGRQFVESVQYKELVTRGLDGNWTTGSVELKSFEFKTTLTEGAGSGAVLVQPDVRPGVMPLLFRRLAVADVIPDGSTSSNLVRYLKETTATNAAATVAEGGVKPESALVFDQVDEPVRKIATVLPVSDEMLEDGPQIQSYIDNRLRLFVSLTEEDQLLNGNGIAPNLTGLLNRAGIQTQALGTDSRADAIFKGATLVRNSFMEPDAMVINPADWQDIQLNKDANGQYFAGGPYSAQAGSSFWGLRPVVTPAIAVGTALVGAFREATQLFRRSGITVEATNSHASFFTSNLTMIRAEERLGLAVYRPSGLVTITGI